MKICPTCNSTLHKDDDKFCYRDGSPLVEMATHDCGRTLSPCDKFCPRCGGPVETKAEARFVAGATNANIQ